MNAIPLGSEWNLPSDMAVAPASPTSATLSGLQDCRSALRQAIDESESVNNAFIPECDEFGNFRPVQCYKVWHTKIPIIPMYYIHLSCVVGTVPVKLNFLAMKRFASYLTSLRSCPTCCSMDFQVIGLL